MGPGNVLCYTHPGGAPLSNFSIRVRDSCKDTIATESEHDRAPLGSSPECCRPSPRPDHPGFLFAVAGLELSSWAVAVHCGAAMIMSLHDGVRPESRGLQATEDVALGISDGLALLLQDREHFLRPFYCVLSRDIARKYLPRSFVRTCARASVLSRIAPSSLCLIQRVFMLITCYNSMFHRASRKRVKHRGVGNWNSGTPKARASRAPACSEASASTPQRPRLPFRLLGFVFSFAISSGYMQGRHRSLPKTRRGHLCPEIRRTKSTRTRNAPAP